LAENVYEGMFIFDSNRYAREPGAVSGEIDQLIESAGGEMLASRLWEERRLAFPIKRQRKGTYWLTYFRLGTDQLAGINRQVEINDNVLRHLILKIDPRLVEPMVAHATGVAQTPPGPAIVVPVVDDDDDDTDD
jgi:small subunit ribosomal protein S6